MDDATRLGGAHRSPRSQLRQRTGMQSEFGDKNRIAKRKLRCYFAEEVFRGNQIRRLADNGESGRSMRPDCPVSATIAVIRGKWKAAIIQVLTPEGLRFGVLLRRIPCIRGSLKSTPFCLSVPGLERTCSSSWRRPWSCSPTMVTAF